MICLFVLSDLENNLLIIALYSITYSSCLILYSMTLLTTPPHLHLAFQLYQDENDSASNNIYNHMLSYLHNFHLYKILLLFTHVSISFDSLLLNYFF